MKFVHIADMHFDTSFTTLTNKANLGDTRRLDQRLAFKKVIDYIKENEIPYLFIAGDFYEHEYIRLSTIEYINNLFGEIPNTQIFISPGNHDPYLKDSFYNKYYWNENVHIFDSKLSVFEQEDIDVYGYGFDDFYYTNTDLENTELKNPEKINILVAHGTLNASNTLEKEYNPISEKMLESKGFDYVALGHIHKLDYNTVPNQKIVYPGSTVSMGFDELGQHGMIVGNIEKGKVELEFVPIDNKEFVVKEIDVTEMLDLEELATSINSIDFSDNIYYKISLIGRRNFEIDLYKLNKLIINGNIIKIKDYTKLNYDLEKISKENTLKGLFVKEILRKMEENPEDEEVLQNALDIGFEILDK
ncbi:MAG: DNA repair exonuclease [Clostridia bacterium]|nr:DNA repair exonuclease [Clostridia bacterium]